MVLSESCQFGDFQFKLGVKTNEKSDFETFHVAVIVLVRGQNDHLPQVDDLSTCGEKGIKNQVDILPT